MHEYYGEALGGPPLPAPRLVPIRRLPAATQEVAEDLPAGAASELRGWADTKPHAQDGARRTSLAAMTRLSPADRGIAYLAAAMDALRHLRAPPLAKVPAPESAAARTPPQRAAKRTPAGGHLAKGAVPLLPMSQRTFAGIHGHELFHRGPAAAAIDPRLDRVYQRPPTTYLWTEPGAQVDRTATGRHH